MRGSGPSPAHARRGSGRRYIKKANKGPMLDTRSLMLDCGTCQRHTRPLSAPLAHQGSTSAAGHLDTASPLPRASCLPVWVMNVYFTYRLSVCGLNGCHISNPSKIRTMCCHCNLKLPRGFFFSFFLVWFGFSFSFHAALVLSYSKNA